LISEILRYVEKRRLENDILKYKHEITKKLDNIEDLLDNTRFEVFNNKKYNWQNLWDKLDKTKKEVRISKDEINSIILERKLTERTKQKELINNVYDYVSAMEAQVYNKDPEKNLSDYANEISMKISNDLNLIERAIKIKDTSLIKRESASDSLEYLVNIFGRLEQFVPEYAPNPRGALITKKKWKVKFNNKKQKVTAKYRRIFGSKLNMLCAKVEDIPSEEEIVKISKKAKNSKTYQVNCYVVPKANQRTKEIVENFAHPNLAFLSYETQTGNLIYNSLDPKVKFFSKYFEKNEKPKGFLEFLREYSQDEVINESLLSKLNFDKRGISKLKKRRYIVPISNGKYMLKEG